jgi:hypothetical protein
MKMFFTGSVICGSSIRFCSLVTSPVIMFSLRVSDHLQLRTGGAGQHQGVAVGVDAHVLQRTALLVQHEGASP